MVSTLLWLFNTVVILYIAVIVAMVIMSWLTNFHLADPKSPLVAQVSRSLYALADPATRPVRRIVPSMGGVDISPIIVILVLEFVRRIVNVVLSGGSAGAAA